MEADDRKNAVCGFIAFLNEDDDEEKPQTPDSVLMLALSFAATMEGAEKSRIKDYIEQVVPGYTEDDFRRMFRLNPLTFEALLQHLKNNPELQPKGPGRREPIPLDKQLLLTLWYLGGNDTIMKIADRFGISESTVIMIRDRILLAILQLTSLLIAFPDDVDTMEEEREFRKRNDFPGIVGALDGTHVRIKAPHEHPQSFVNRKGFHSIQLQCVCRHNMLFSHCYAGYPGSCHDARILRNSDLWEVGPIHCEPDYHILGDGAYPVRKWLLTPFRDNGHLTPQQKRFNHYHSSNRVVIERAFALLKNRFRRLHYIDTTKVSTAVDIIMACCVLHNLCILENDEIEEHLSQTGDNETDADAGIIGYQGNDQNAQGVQKRNQIALNLA